jgi:hypothetical protein
MQVPKGSRLWVFRDVAWLPPRMPGLVEHEDGSGCIWLTGFDLWLLLVATGTAVATDERPAITLPMVEAWYANGSPGLDPIAPSANACPQCGGASAAILVPNWPGVSVDQPQTPKPAGLGVCISQGDQDEAHGERRGAVGVDRSDRLARGG